MPCSGFRSALPTCVSVDRLKWAGGRSTVAMRAFLHWAAAGKRPRHEETVAAQATTVSDHNVGYNRSTSTNWVCWRTFSPKARVTQNRSPPLRSSSSPGPYMLISMPHDISTAVGFFQNIIFLQKVLVQRNKKCKRNNGCLSFFSVYAKGRVFSSNT